MGLYPFYNWDFILGMYSETYSPGLMVEDKAKVCQQMTTI